VTAPPGTSEWSFPPVEQATPEGLVGVGADLEPATILDAYARGIFPMPIPEVRMVGWWSPDPRGVLPLERLHVSRSLRRSVRRFSTTVNRAFERVIAGCADPMRPHGWITPEIVSAYTRLHVLGAAHSVEVWSEDGTLVGGLYGVALGGLFAAESKFHRETDASKVALVRLVEELQRDGPAPSERLLDVQWCTPHLVSLGAIEISRGAYLRRLEEALAADPVAGFGR
jgi:leucyl/phenylalanyl-tRNA--protein transferase